MTSPRELAHKAEHALDKIKFRIKDKLNLFDPVILYPYRGYGNASIAYLPGRVLEKEHMIHDKEEDKDYTLWSNIRKVWKRYESDEIPGVEIEATLQGIKSRAVSDEEGYFHLKFDLTNLSLENGWHEVSLRIIDMPFDLEYEEETKAEILINNETGRLAIISDVDDTIIESNAMNSLKKMKIMLTKSAKDRVAFEGVSKLYHALIKDYSNPLFFVSGSSYNLYDMLVSFCKAKDIPKAPLLLRNLGLEPEQWIKQDTSPYKIKHISHILDTYPSLNFVCIGDSGQQDPEIYLEINKRHPDRIKAIYIRHVDTDKRQDEINKLNQDNKVPLVLIDHSEDIIEHMKQNNLL